MLAPQKCSAWTPPSFLSLRDSFTNSRQLGDIRRKPVPPSARRNSLRKANRGDDSQNRWAWLVLAKTWLLLAKTQEIAENSIEAGGQELKHLDG